MISVFISVFLLGLMAIDPIGIAAMPILLSQKNPYSRSGVFLAGSFIALILAGIIFSLGLGSLLLQFEQSHHWIIPGLELFAGSVLIVVGIYMLIGIMRRNAPGKSSDFVVRRLQLGNTKLFLFGAVLVTVQSIVDLVFIVAMIKVGTLHLSFVLLVLVSVTYAIAALFVQVAVVIMYRFTAIKRQASIARTVQRLTMRYANVLAMSISFILGGILVLNYILVSLGYGLF